MSVLDKAAQIPADQCFAHDSPDFVRECIRVMDTATSTNWGLINSEKITATLLKAWADAASAASAGVDEDEVAELRNKLKGANMARGRLEKQVETLKEFCSELQANNSESDT